MGVKALARELANLQYETGYTFENGVARKERLGETRALSLIRSLQEKGYAICRQDVAAHDGERQQPASRRETV